MVLNLTDEAPATAVIDAVMDLPACDLERRVLAAARPCTSRPDAWFPDEPDGRRIRARALFEARALTLCRPCPVAIECLELTLRREGPVRGCGVAGGTASWQRQEIKRGRGWPVQGGAR